MTNFYAKNDNYGSAYEPIVDYKYGTEDTSFKAHYEVKVHDAEKPYL